MWLKFSKKIYYYSILILLFTGCRSDGSVVHSWDLAQSAECNIASNAIPLDNGEDFSFLKDIVKDRRVVMLGEAGHGDLTTTTIKAKMLETLRECGFRTITFECIPMLASYAYGCSEFADITDVWSMTSLLGSPWIQQPAFEPVAEMIRKRQMKLFGMDDGVSDLDFSIVHRIISTHSQSCLLQFDSRRARQLWEKMVQSRVNNGEFSVEEQQEYMEMMNRLRSWTDCLIATEGVSEDLATLKQWLGNVDQMYVGYTTPLMRSIGESTASSDKLFLALSNRMRDARMAENVRWYLDNHPNEKIIIWCANFHCAKDISQAAHPEFPLMYYQFHLLGENLADFLGDKLYSLAFTSLSYDAYENEPGALECAVADQTQNSPFAFINLEKLRHHDGYRDALFESSAILKKKGCWLNIFDGIYYIRNQQTSLPE